MGGHLGAALFTRRAAGRTATPKVALGDTNFELAQAPVNPRRERMDDPQFETDDARNIEPHKVQAKTMIPILQDVEALKSRFEALKGSGDPEKEKALDDITSACDLITHHVLDISEDAGAPKKARLFRRQASPLPLELVNAPGEGKWMSAEEYAQACGISVGAARARLYYAKQKPGSVQRSVPASPGSARKTLKSFPILTYWVTEGMLTTPKQALVHMHTTPPKGAPRPDQRTHLDEEFKAELEADKDPDLVRHTTGKSASEAPLLEALAALEHQQWVEWSKNIADTEDLSDERVDRWEEAWVAYSALSDEEKEKDRVYARKIITLLEKKGIPLQQSKEAGRLFS